MLCVLLRTHAPPLDWEMLARLPSAQKDAVDNPSKTTANGRD
jgi:hypothetical protein